MTAMHLADLAALPLTPEDVATIRDLLRPIPHVHFVEIGKRGAICHWPSGEPVQFVTRLGLPRLKWTALDWSERFEAEKRKAAER